MEKSTAKNFDEIARHFDVTRDEVCTWRDACKQQELFQNPPFELEEIAEWRRMVQADRNLLNSLPVVSTDLPPDRPDLGGIATAIRACNTARALPTITHSGFAEIRDNMIRRKLREENAKRMYPWNLAIILMFLIVMGTWFYRHINPLFVQPLVVGIPLSLWTSWKLLQSWFPERLKFDRSALVTRILSRPYMRCNLLISLLIPLILLFSTSSVYIEHGSGSQTSTIEIWTVDPKTKKANELLMDRLTVSSVDKVKGRPFFNFPYMSTPKMIELRIVKPFGFEQETRDLRPWSRVYLRTNSFKRKTYRAIRLIPNQGLLKFQPRVCESEDAYNYSAKVYVDNKLTKTIPSLMLECIYLGQSERAIEGLIRDEPVENRRMIVRNSLFRAAKRGEELQTYTDVLVSSYRKVEGIVLKAGSTIVVEVWSTPSGGAKLEWKSTPILVSKKGGIQTILMEADGS